MTHITTYTYFTSPSKITSYCDLLLFHLHVKSPALNSCSNHTKAVERASLVEMLLSYSQLVPWDGVLGLWV